MNPPQPNEAEPAASATRGLHSDSPTDAAVSSERVAPHPEHAATSTRELSPGSASLDDEERAARRDLMARTETPAEMARVHRELRDNSTAALALAERLAENARALASLQMSVQRGVIHALAPGIGPEMKQDVATARDVVWCQALWATGNMDLIKRVTELFVQLRPAEERPQLESRLREWATRPQRKEPPDWDIDTLLWHLRMIAETLQENSVDPDRQVGRGHIALTMERAAHAIECLRP